MNIRYDNDGNAIITMTREAAQSLLFDAALYNSDKARNEEKVNIARKREDKCGIVNCLRARQEKLTTAFNAIKRRRLLPSDFSL